MKNAVIWSKPNCPYCEQAKDLLNKKGLKFEVRTIGADGWTREKLLEAVPTARTVPQIFIEDEYIGGFTELKEKFKNQNVA